MMLSSLLALAVTPKLECGNVFRRTRYTYRSVPLVQYCHEARHL